MTARISTGEVNADHDAVIAWLDHMKGVYQRVLEKHSRMNGVNTADIAKARNHLRALEMVEKTVREHHEMEKGRPYPGGKTRGLGLTLETVATLILPDGTRKEILRNG